ncbi:MAG: ADP-ribosylglycohydrolase family protein [Huintestinicola sp.]
MRTDNNDMLISKSRGCLIGGAAGDSLGYAVEFLPEQAIANKYGETGITRYDRVNNIARVSDDTQMSLFTADALLRSDSKKNGIDTERLIGYFRTSYLDWFKTQFPKNTNDTYFSNIIENNELWAARAPGGTCLSALEAGGHGTINAPINDSKGCGGVMRVAPIAAYFCNSVLSCEDIAMIGAHAAAITHNHELGYIPAAALVYIICRIMREPDADLKDIVIGSISAMKRLFPKAEHLSELMLLLEKAILLSSENIDDIDAIHELGEGWVAEETLAIAVYCSLKHIDSFEEAIIASVNHGGDSDSTGAVTGNILGSYLGIDAISSEFQESLELYELMTDLADKLITGVSDFLR